ncbi:hypothetical protein V8C86DRAFT_3107356 [Haematococcus lacustris]
MSSRAALGGTGGTGGFFGAGGIGCGYIIGGSAIRAPAAPRCPWASERRRGWIGSGTEGRRGCCAAAGAGAGGRRALVAVGPRGAGGRASRGAGVVGRSSSDRALMRPPGPPSSTSRKNTTTSGRSSAASAMAVTRFGIRYAGWARASAVADPSSRLASMARIKGGGDGAAPVVSSSPDWEVVKWVDPALAMPEQQPGSLVGAASWARRHDGRRSIPTAPDGRWAVAAIATAAGDLPLVVVFIRLVEEGGLGGLKRARSEEERPTTPAPREARPPAPLGPTATRARRPPAPAPAAAQQPRRPSVPPPIHPRRRSPAQGQRGAAGARIAAPPMTQHPPSPPAPMQPPVPPVPQPVPPVPQPVPPVPQQPSVPQPMPPAPQKPLVPLVPPNAALLDMFWDDIDGIDVGILGGLFLV